MLKILFVLIGIITLSIFICLLQDFLFEKYDTEKANEILIFIIFFPIIIFLIAMGLYVIL